MDELLIKVAGIGGGGNNAINRMIESENDDVEFLSIHTDSVGFNRTKARNKVQIGLRETKGRGAGSIPEIGRLAAEESINDISLAVSGCQMLFITAGMGGGTGTGAAPVIAREAKRQGILTIAVVTKPFAFEGKKRMNNAEDGIRLLEECVDALIVIPNDNLKKMSDSKITLGNAFAVADEVLMQTVNNVVELIKRTAYINCDFADICSIIRDSGRIHTATATASGQDRVGKIIEKLKYNVLLDTSTENASAVLLFITACADVGLDEVDKISSAVSNEANTDANIIFGLNFENAPEFEIKAVLISVCNK